MHDIPVINNIIFSFNKEFSGFPAGMFCFQPDKIIIFHDLCPDESPFKVAVNDPCSLWCRHAFFYGPCPDFLGPGSEKVLKVEQVKCRTNQPVDPGFAQTGIGKKDLPVFCSFQFSDFGFQFSGNN